MMTGFSNQRGKGATAYLDYNATAPVLPAVIDAMVEAMREGGNPSSVHGPGRAAHRRLEDARAAIASRVGCRPAEVIFTSGGTEANNLALSGLPARRLLWAATEHDSIRAIAEAWPNDAVMIPVDHRGLLRTDVLEAELKAGEGAIVAVMLANNETGVIQDIPEIARLVHAHGGHLHVDAVQAFGKISVHFGALQAHSMSLSAHKIGGPQGVGALILRDDITIAARNRGGGQELGRRAGTENLPGIVGFARAAELLDLDAAAAVAALRDGLEARILQDVPQAVIFGRDAPRLPNTICVAVPGAASETQVMALDLAGVAVSAGSACSSGKVRQSHVLAAMGAGDLASAAIRVSLGRHTSAMDLDRFFSAWMAFHARRRKAVAS